MNTEQFNLMKTRIVAAEHTYGKLDPERFRDLPWRKVELLTADQMKTVLMGVASGRALPSLCKELHIDPFKVMKTRFADPEFNVAYEQAVELRKLAFEEKAVELALEGQAIKIKKGDTVITRYEYPVNALLQFLLKAEMPNKYGVERKEIKAGPLDTPPETIQGDADRERLLNRIKDRMVARNQQKQIIEAQAVALGEDLL